jgi:hypothetical protein
MIETRTGDVLRLSASGSVIDTVKTDPRLVPNHSVGISVDGSAETFIQIKKNETSVERVRKDKLPVNLPLFFV